VHALLVTQVVDAEDLDIDHDGHHRPYGRDLDLEEVVAHAHGILHVWIEYPVQLGVVLVLAVQHLQQREHAVLRKRDCTTTWKLKRAGLRPHEHALCFLEVVGGHTPQVYAHFVKGV
jgi:hypothetical protein